MAMQRKVLVWTNRAPDPFLIFAHVRAGEVADTAAVMAGYSLRGDSFSLQIRGGDRDGEVLHRDEAVPEGCEGFDLSITAGGV